LNTDISFKFLTAAILICLLWPFATEEKLEFHASFHYKIGFKGKECPMDATLTGDYTSFNSVLLNHA